MTIKQALVWGTKQLRKSGSSALDAEVLLLYSFNQQNKKSTKQEINKIQRLITKPFLYSDLDFVISSKAEKKYKKLIAQRQKGVPAAYITGHKEFFGLDFFVDESVLIPRPETELLVELALEQISNQEPVSSEAERSKISNILDVGTGSGCIIVASAANFKSQISNLKINYYATDISATAVKIAQINAKKHRVKIKFFKSDLFSYFNLIKGAKNIRPYNNYTHKFDLIIANLPYLDPKWIGKELKYEPISALDGGKNGLCIIEKFLSEASNYLSSKGSIFIEIDPRQKDKIKKLSKIYFPNKNIRLKKDLSGSSRVLIIS